jgi:serine/threonine protein kinase
MSFNLFGALGSHRMAGADTFGWVGRIIDDQFAVESVAGEGGFGVVYRGVHLGFDAPIAIKCLKIPGHVGKEQRAELVARFRAEAKLLYRLSRLTWDVVQALHVGIATAPSGSWTPYIVMEWLEGETPSWRVLQGLSSVPSLSWPE